MEHARRQGHRSATPPGHDRPSSSSFSLFRAPCSRDRESGSWECPFLVPTQHRIKLTLQITISRTFALLLLLIFHNQTLFLSELDRAFPFFSHQPRGRQCRGDFPI